MSRCVLAREVWKVKVEKGPSEHGVYKLGYLWLAPTFMNEFWKVDPDRGAVVGRFQMPGIVWGAPWVDEDALYGASGGGFVRKFGMDGREVWTVNPGLGDFTAEAVVEAWSRYLAVQFPKGLAVLDKEDGTVVWSVEWSPEGPYSQEPTFDPETGLLWVCRPTAENNLVAFDREGRVVWRFTLPSPATTYACPQIWSRYLVVVCERHVVVVDRFSKKHLWSLDFGRVYYAGKPADALTGGPRTLTPDGKLLVWTIDGLYSCFDLENGVLLWRLDMGTLGYATRDSTTYWGYRGAVASGGLAVFLGCNNLPMDSDNPYGYDRNRLFILDYESGRLVYVSEPRYRLACCCKPILFRGRVVIGTWYKDSEDNEFPSYYYCWEIEDSSGRWGVDDRVYEWMGGWHHGGYSV